MQVSPRDVEISKIKEILGRINIAIGHNVRVIDAKLLSKGFCGVS
jgi:hypothetical protein